MGEVKKTTSQKKGSLSEISAEDIKTGVINPPKIISVRTYR